MDTVNNALGPRSAENSRYLSKYPFYDRSTICRRSNLHTRQYRREYRSLWCFDNCILIEVHEYVGGTSKAMHGLPINERDNQVLSSQYN